MAVLTDFGTDSFYAGVLRAVIQRAAPEAAVVDVTHSIPPYAVSQASFVLARIYGFFPRDSVFLAVVDPGVGGARRNVIARAGGRFFVGPDNGVFTEVLSLLGEPRVYVIDDSKLSPFRGFDAVGRTFLGRDVFAPAAAAVASGADPLEVAVPAAGVLERLVIPEVEVRPGRVSGPARYVDSFGNILTGITDSHLQRAFSGAAGNVRVRAGATELGPLGRFYGEAAPGTVRAVLNSWDVVEVCEVQGRAADRFDEQELEGLRIDLYEEKG